MTLLEKNWLAADWPAPEFIKAGTTLRKFKDENGQCLGHSLAPYDDFNLASHVGDQAEAVNKNRLLLNTPGMPQWLEQTHSTEVVLLPTTENIPHADASYSREKNIVCAVLTADCLPVLITDIKGECIAAVHAGWRGLHDGIIEKTINKLQVHPAELLVWLGPAIGANVYEVGEEVYDAFCKHDKEAEKAFVAIKGKNILDKGKPESRHWLFDLYKMARLRLSRVGVGQVFGGGLCSFSDQKRFYSYRRQTQTGRMASLIWIEQ